MMIKIDADNFGSLNTSHVKVNCWNIVRIQVVLTCLNTSHVKVNLVRGPKSLHRDLGLNTSHVKVNFAILTNYVNNAF